MFCLISAILKLLGSSGSSSVLLWILSKIFG